MRIYRRHHHIDPADQNAVVAIGNFDGVHLGHAKVIRAAAKAARAEGTTCALLTFEPHPRQFFQPEIGPFRLTPFRTKIRLLTDLGVETIFNLRFSQALAQTSAEDFIGNILVDGLGVGSVVVGPNFRFGRGRRGDNRMLANYAVRHGFRLIEIPMDGDSGDAFSSSRVRKLIGEGEVAQASRILGRLWEVEGHVRAGHGQGQELGFPTANFSLDRILHPAAGIYAVRAGIVDRNDTHWQNAAAYVGDRPTFGGSAMALEVHLLEQGGNLYGKRIRVAFVEMLRRDEAFADSEALRRQIAADCERARHVLADPGILDFLAKPSAA